MADISLLDALFFEYEQFYQTLASDKNTIPRSISGVNDKGEQFIFILDGYGMDHVQRDQFIKTILRLEYSTMFAYGTLLGGFNEETKSIDEELIIVVASRDHFIRGIYAVAKDKAENMMLMKKDIVTGDNPDDPTMWFLSRSPELSTVEHEDIARWWNSLGNSVMRLQR